MNSFVEKQDNSNNLNKLIASKPRCLFFITLVGHLGEVPVGGSIAFEFIAFDSRSSTNRKFSNHFGRQGRTGKQQIQFNSIIIHSDWFYCCSNFEVQG